MRRGSTGAREVKFWQRNIGDYATDTAHLSLAEHGAYVLMLDAAYATERPLPTDVRSIYRMVRAHGANERAAVRSVLDQFWTLGPDGYTNERVAEEFARVTDRSSAARRSANARWQAVRQADDDDERTREPAPNAPDLSARVSASPRSNAEIVVAIYHETCPMLPRVRLLTDARVRAIDRRRRDTLATRDAWREYFGRVAGTPFLTGENDRGWRANIDWLVRPANVARVLEGTYGEDAAERERRRQAARERVAEREREHERRMERDRRIHDLALEHGLWKPGDNLATPALVRKLRARGLLPDELAP